MAHDALEMMKASGLSRFKFDMGAPEEINPGTGKNHFLRDNRTTAAPTISNLDIFFKNVVIIDTTGGVIYGGIRETI